MFSIFFNRKINVESAHVGGMSCPWALEFHSDLNNQIINIPRVYVRRAAGLRTHTRQRRTVLWPTVSSQKCWPVLFVLKAKADDNNTQSSRARTQRSAANRTRLSNTRRTNKSLRRYWFRAAARSLRPDVSYNNNNYVLYYKIYERMYQCLQEQIYLLKSPRT